MVICLEQGTDLHMAQLMPLPLTISCFSKIQIGFTFVVPAHLGSPGQRAVKRARARACARVRACVRACVCQLLRGVTSTGNGGSRSLQPKIILEKDQQTSATAKGLRKIC